MKKLLFVLFLMPLFAIAQDCTLKKDSDPVTNELKMVTGFVPFNADGIQFSISMETNSKEVNIFFLIERPSPCFKDESTAMANIAGTRSKIKLKNIGGENCQGIFQVMYRNTAVPAPYLDRLSTTKIGSIDFKVNPEDEKPLTITLSTAQQQQMMDMFSCIVKEAKKLVR